MTDTPRTDDPFDEDAFDDIEDDPEPHDADTDVDLARVESAMAAPTIVKRGVGVPIVLGTAILAAIAGAAGGYGLTAMFPPVEETSGEVAELRTQMDRLDSSDRLEALGARLETVEARRTPRIDLSPLEARLDTLERRADVLEATEPTTLEDVMTTGVVEATAGAVASPTPAQTPTPALTPTPTLTPTPALTPALARRLAQLERRVAELEAQPATPTSAPVTTQPEDSAPTSGPASANFALDDVPAYPLAAVEAAIAETEPSRFRRMLRVRDRDVVEALSDLETALDQDDLAAALEAHARLPESARSEAADWERAVRAALR